MTIPELFEHFSEIRPFRKLGQNMGQFGWESDAHSMVLWAVKYTTFVAFLQTVKSSLALSCELEIKLAFKLQLCLIIPSTPLPTAAWGSKW